MKTAVIIISSFLVLFLIFIVIYLTVIKPKTEGKDKSTSKPEDKPSVGGGLCEGYSQEQQDADKKNAKLKCYEKNLIPIVGQFEMVKCLNSLKLNLKPVKNC
jgi:hypothetical protein